MHTIHRPLPRVLLIAACALAVALLHGACSPAPAEGLTPVGAVETPLPAATLATPRHSATVTATPAPAPPPPATPEPTPTSEPAATPWHQGMTPAQLVRVIDGDTIEVEVDGATERVRYTGIDAPEPDHGYGGAEWLGEEARATNARLLAAGPLWLEGDAEERDGYDRLLRHVWVEGLLVNAEMVRSGYARSQHYPPNLRHQDLYDRVQSEAQAAGIGLWGAPPRTPVPGDPDCAYVGNRSSKKLHLAGCDSVALMAARNIVCFADRDEAASLGYEPCQRCKP